MGKITYGELERVMYEHNKKYGIEYGCGYNKEKQYAVIVFTEDSFDKPYTEQQRSYQIQNDSKMFFPSMIGKSLSGDCLDGTDLGVRLDWYMGGKDGWKVEYCYLIDEPLVTR